MIATLDCPECGAGVHVVIGNGYDTVWCSYCHSLLRWTQNGLIRDKREAVKTVTEDERRELDEWRDDVNRTLLGLAEALADARFFLEAPWWRRMFRRLPMSDVYPS